MHCEWERSSAFFNKNFLFYSYCGKGVLMNEKKNIHWTFMNEISFVPINAQFDIIWNSQSGNCCILTLALFSFDDRFQFFDLNLILFYINILMCVYTLKTE